MVKFDKALHDPNHVLHIIITHQIEKKNERRAISAPPTTNAAMDVETETVDRAFNYVLELGPLQRNQLVISSHLSETMIPPKNLIQCTQAETPLWSAIRWASLLLAILWISLSSAILRASLSSAILRASTLLTNRQEWINVIGINVKLYYIVISDRMSSDDNKSSEWILSGSINKLGAFNYSSFVINNTDNTKVAELYGRLWNGEFYFRSFQIGTYLMHRQR